MGRKAPLISEVADRSHDDVGPEDGSGPISLKVRLLVVATLGLCVLIPGVVLIAVTGFNGLYVKDSFAYFEYAIGPLSASLRDGAPPPPFFWPPGYPLLVALVSTIVGPIPLAGQVVSLIAASSIPISTALLASQVWVDARLRWRVPLLAGVLTAFAGQLWQYSLVVMSDAAGLAAATLAMWAAARFGRATEQPSTPDTRWLILAAAAMAFAVLTRWGYALVAMPWAAYLIVALVRQPRRAIWQAAAAAAIVFVILAPLMGSALEVLRGTASIENPPAFAGLVHRSWDPANAFRMEVTTPDGTLRWRLPTALWYALAPAHWSYFTPLLAILVFPGLWFGLRKPSREILLLVLGWAGIVYFFLATDQYQTLRYALMYVPPFTILAAIGAVAVYDRLSARNRRWLALLIVIGVLLMGYGGYTQTRSLISQKESLIAMTHSVEAAVPGDAQVLVFGPTQILQHESALDIHEIFWLRQEDIERLLCNGRPTFVLLDVDNVVTQWKDRSPEINYRWLRDLPGLEILDRHGVFSLFHVSSGEC